MTDTRVYTWIINQAAWLRWYLHTERATHTLTRAHTRAHIYMTKNTTSLQGQRKHRVKSRKWPRFSCPFCVSVLAFMSRLNARCKGNFYVLRWKADNIIQPLASENKQLSDFQTDSVAHIELWVKLLFNAILRPVTRTKKQKKKKNRSFNWPGKQCTTELRSNQLAALPLHPHGVLKQQVALTLST